jgi:hypothetical protein
VSPKSKAISPEEAAMMDLLERPETALPQGVPDVSGPQYGVSNVSPPPPDFEAALKSPANIAPVVGTGIGGVMGGVPGAMLGGGVGTAVNQITGLSPRSNLDMALGVMAPAVGGPANLGRGMFGARGAQMLNALAPEEAAMHVAKLEPQIASKYLFETATQSGALIPTNRTMATIESMVSDLGTSSVGEKAYKPAVHALNRLKDKLNASGGNLTPKQMQAELEAIGDLSSQSEGKARGAYKQVFKAMSHDLDAVANMADEVGTPAAIALKEARATFKRERAVQEIQDLLTDNFKFLKGQGAHQSFNAASILNAMQKSDFIQQSFSKQELKEMEGLLTKLNKIPGLRPGAGQQAGSFSVMKGPMSGAGMGSLAAMGTGLGDPGAMALLGAATGVVLPPLAEATRNFATALSMQTGRAMIKQLLKNSNGALTPQGLSMISAYAEAVRAGQEGAVAP